MDKHFLTDIEIKQFKCFTDFKASGFKRVNLIGGKNNIGKTALMEACLINVRSNNINEMIFAISYIEFARERLNLDSFNRDEILNNIKTYCAKSNLSSNEFFIKDLDGIKEYIFNINGYSKNINSNNLSYPDIVKQLTPSYSKFLDSHGESNPVLSGSYQIIQMLDKEIELNTYIQKFDDNIESFKVIGGVPFCKKNSEYRKITNFGDGLRNYISIICSLYVCENSYLFIDEIDNGIYYEHFDRLWEIILTLSKQTNCQVFATTHSKEMLESFARVAKKLDEQDISYTLLVKNKKQELKTISLGYKGLLESTEQDIEVR
jgi:AAA15 family ATPase/GTPase